MSSGRNEHIREALRIVRDLIFLADEGENDAPDDGCRVLFMIVRDCAYVIRTHAEREREIHKATGTWDEADGGEANSRERQITQCAGDD